MRFARVHKVASYLLAALGLIALCAGGELGGAPTVVLVLGFGASWFAEGDILHSPRYARAWNAAVVAALAVEVARVVFFSLAPLTAAVEFASLLQLSRLSNRRTARDYQQITVLAMLHLIAATVLGGGLSYAACFLGFVIVTPWAMTLGHLRREIEGNYLAEARAGRAGVPIDVARILRSRRVVGPGLLIGSSLLAIPIFALTAVIFVAFPRIGLGIFSIQSSHGNTVTGFGDRVDLSGHGTIRDDPTVVLRVIPPTLPAVPPPFLGIRLRGAAFDTYDGMAWSRHAATRVPVPSEGPEFRVGRRYSFPSDQRYRVVIDALDPPVVLLPPGTVAMQVEPRIEAGLPRYPTITRDEAGEVRYQTSDDLGLSYVAYVDPRPHPAPLGPAERERYLALPAVSPELVALAHRLTDAEPDPLTKARAVARYLQGFRYTLAIESGRAARPVEDFLFRTRAGHCEYFSTAMAVLLRAVGVPTRNVTGFLGGTYNRYGRFYAVRQGDAHSWVEVHDDARGWVTFDPTPPAREAPVVRSGVLAELDAVVEALRMRWRRYVVGFDLGTQARIVMRMINALSSSPRGVARSREAARGDAGWAQRVRARLNGTAWPAVPFALALAAAVAVYARSLYRRRRARGGAGARAPRSVQVRDAIALAQALDTALAARGHPRARSRSPVAFANELARSGAAIGPLAQRVAARYAEARFGGEPLASGELDALRRALREAPSAPQ